MRDLDMARVEPEEVAGPRVLLVEDHMLFGEAMRVAMAAAGLEVVAVVGTGPDALTAADVLRPDLALVDLHMADMDGIDLGRRMLERHPGMKLIMVTGYPDSTALQRAIEAKFQGFLSKDVSMREFVAAVRAVSEGHVVMPVNLASRIVGIRSDDERMAALNAKQLTPREWEILRLLVQGVSSGGIAQRLSISVNTVRTHVQNILAKLQVRSRLEAVAFATRYRLVDVQVHG